MIPHNLRPTFSAFCCDVGTSSRCYNCVHFVQNNNKKTGKKKWSFSHNLHAERTGRSRRFRQPKRQRQIWPVGCGRHTFVQQKRHKTEKWSYAPEWHGQSSGRPRLSGQRDVQRSELPRGFRQAHWKPQMWLVSAIPCTQASKSTEQKKKKNFFRSGEYG